MHRMIGLIASVAIAAGAFLLPTAAIAAPNATVWVLHGVPGAKVDVCVNGAEVASNFTYGNRFSASLPDGAYRVAIRAAEPGTCTGEVVKRRRVAVDAGKNYSLVAGLSGGGAVRIFAFQNRIGDTSGDARLQVRHTAAAPAVDVWAEGSPLFTDLTSGEEATAVVPPASYEVAVALAGTMTVAIGPRTFELSDDMAYQVYATGNGSAGYRFMVLAQPTK
jgi:uncharacterized protein YaiE (UPF0345 family)